MFRTYTPLHYKLTLLCAYSFLSHTRTHFKLGVATILDSRAATKIHPAERRTVLKAFEWVCEISTVSLGCCVSKLLTFVDVRRMSHAIVSA